MTLLYNNATGGTNGVTASAANTGGQSGKALDTATPGTYPVFSNAQAYPGALSYKLAANFNGAGWTFTSGSSDYYERVYAYVPSFATSTSKFTVCGVYNGSLGFAGLASFLGHGDGTARLNVTFKGNAGNVSGTYSIAAGTWYRVEMHFSNVVSGFTEAWLYSTSGTLLDHVTTGTSDQSGFVGLSNIAWFGDANGVATALPYYLDCLALSDSSRLLDTLEATGIAILATGAGVAPKVYVANARSVTGTGTAQRASAAVAAHAGIATSAGTSPSAKPTGNSPNAVTGMDSLVLCGQFELLGGGAVQSDIPELVNAAGIGVIYRLLAPGGNTSGLNWSVSYDLGTHQPATDIVQSLLLDGERPYGYRSSNRTIKLPIYIAAPDFVTLGAAREKLLQAVDQQQYSLVWTSGATGLPMVFDSFRAQAATIAYGFLYNKVPSAVITLTFEALPFGRTDPGGLIQIPFANSLFQGITPPPPPLILDSFAAVSGTNWSQNSQWFVTGPHSARYKPPILKFPYPPAIYTKTGLNNDITGLTALSVWFGQSYDNNWPQWPAFRPDVILAWTLTDGNGHTLKFSKIYRKVPWNANPDIPTWTRISAAIPQGQTGFDYTTISSYSVRISNWTGGGTTGYVRMNAWLDSVTANPPTLSVPVTPRGLVHTIMGTPAIARTPISCQFQQPASSPFVQELDDSGYFIPPPGVISLTCLTIAAGGAGSSRTTTGVGGGGGGGESAQETLTVVPGVPIPYNCGLSGLPGNQAPVVTLYTAPGTYYWTCPDGIFAILAETLGGGAGGANSGGGGGGGGYGARTALAVTPGLTYQVIVGPGGQQGGYGNPSYIYGDTAHAAGAGGGAPSGGTSGGLGGFANVGDITHNGGNGGTAPSTDGGGGGGSGGTSSAGNAGQNGTGSIVLGGAAVAGGGGGGNGGTQVAFATPGLAPGGGGGGSVTGSLNGQPGANGQARITYTPPSSNGGDTLFGSVATTGIIVHAHGGITGTTNSVTGAAGGTGSVNALHNNGGAGWTASGGTGGGTIQAAAGLATGYGTALVPGYNAGSSRLAAVAGLAGAQGTAGTAVTNPSGGGSTINAAAELASGQGTALAPGYSAGSSALVVVAKLARAQGTTGNAVTSYPLLYGGGGGGSGGTASVGNAAVNSLGAPAVTGGGKGANGGGINQGGASAVPPGGGGGGADMVSVAGTGGLGGAGQILLTWSPPIKKFSTLIVHRPGSEAPPTLNPCVSVSGSSVPSTGWPVSSLIPGINALFSGTYTVLAVASFLHNPTVSKTVTIYVNQFEYSLTGPYVNKSVTRTFTPSTDITNGIINMGEITLPILDIDPSNTSALFTVSPVSSDINDTFFDVLFLDSQGQTLIVNLPDGTAYGNIWIDEPTSERDAGRVLASNLDRAQAVSILGDSIFSGGPFYIVSGDNVLLAYSVSGAPDIAVSYLARWFNDRLR